MAPEYGATCGFFPVDAETIRYLERTGRDPAQVALVEQYCRAQRLFHTARCARAEVQRDARNSTSSTVVPSVAGPKRPQDLVRAHRPAAELCAEPPGPDAADRAAGAPRAGRRPRSDAGTTRAARRRPATHGTHRRLSRCEIDGEMHELHDGSVVIAAITSCTNTSNPSVMVGAGLLARKAAAKGLRAQAWVKTSMAPGLARGHRLSHPAPVSTRTSTRSGSRPWATAAPPASATAGRFPEPVATAIDEHSLVTAAVLSGNRNFEARVHPQVRANYLDVADAGRRVRAARSRRRRHRREPLGTGNDGKPVFLRDIWPSPNEIADDDERLPRPRPVPHTSTARSSTATRNGARSRCPRARDSPGIPTAPTCSNPPFFTDLAGRTVAAQRHHRRPGARGARRLGHDRSHLARRRDPEERSGGQRTCASTASSSPTGTPSARGAAITK